MTLLQNTLYITTPDGKKIEDTDLLAQLQSEFSTLISRPETSG